MTFQSVLHTLFLHQSKKPKYLSAITSKKLHFFLASFILSVENNY